MSGLGYTHPLWGHGLDHGPELAVAHDSLSETDRGWGNPLPMHVQALVTAELADGGSVHRGMGVLEQFFVGPHAPTGLTGLMDPPPLAFRPPPRPAHPAAPATSPPG